MTHSSSSSSFSSKVVVESLVEGLKEAVEWESAAREVGSRGVAEVEASG
jgi:hypothetical protein